MIIHWTHHPANNHGSFHRSEVYRGFIESEDAMILVAIIFKEDNTWLVSLQDVLNSSEFQQVHAKLQEILSGTPPA